MTQMNFNQATQAFRNEYQGPKIAFLIAGGGFSALDFRKYPGSSRLYHTAIEPYNVDTANFLNKFSGQDIQDPENFSFVNPEGTAKALEGLANYCDTPDLLYVVVNSACTTDRYRRGENRAYIATSRGEMFVFEMSKLSQEEYQVVSSKGNQIIDQIRHNEDIRIGQVALAIIMNDPSLFPDLEDGEKILKIPFPPTTMTFTPNVIHSSN